MTHPEADSVFLAYLADRDVECPACGYNLRGLRTARCPECGEHLRLRLAPAEPRQGACIAGLVGLAMGAGFSGLLLLYFLIMTMSVGMPPQPFWKFIAVMAGGLLLQGGLLLWWIQSWRRIRRMSAFARRSLAIGCFLLSLGNLAMFTASVR